MIQQILGKQSTWMGIKTDEMAIEFLVETIAKALCFENYIATVEVDDIEEIDLKDAMDSFSDNEELYMKKSVDLLALVKSTKGNSETLH